jgi:hypothetical protein
MNRLRIRPRRARAAQLALVLAPLAVACGGGSTREAAIVTDSAGVTIVVNPDRGMWTIDTRWSLVPRPRIQVGNQPYDPDQRIYRGEHTRLRSDGAIVVANRGMGDVRIFDAGGYHLATLRLQRDPTLEVGRPRRVYPQAGDTLLVYEAGGGLAVYAPDNELLRRFSVALPDEPYWGDPEPAGPFADGSFLVIGRFAVDSTRTGMQRSTMRLMRFGADGRFIESFGDYEDATEIVGDEIYVFGPTGVVAAGDSTVWYSDTESYELREIASGGRLVRIVRLDLPPPPVMTADLSAFRVGAVRQLRREMSDEEAEATVDGYTYAETFPTFDQLIVDELGNIWARSYRWFDMGADYLWRVFDREGRYLGEVVVPYPLTVHQIGADYVLGHMSDGRGGEAVYIYTLEKPPEGS